MVCQCEGSWETLWINGCLLNILTGLSSFLWFDLVTYVTGEIMTHLTQICRLTWTGFSTGLNYSHELKTRLTGVRTTTTNRKPKHYCKTWGGRVKLSLQKFWQVKDTTVTSQDNLSQQFIKSYFSYICIPNSWLNTLLAIVYLLDFPERSWYHPQCQKCTRSLTH